MRHFSLFFRSFAIGLFAASALALPGFIPAITATTVVESPAATSASSPTPTEDTASEPIPEEKAPEKEQHDQGSHEAVGGKMMYVCMDATAPCISDAADGCSGCPKEVKHVPYSLHEHMEVVGKAMGGLREDLKAGAGDKAKPKAALLKLVASRMREFQPPKNAKDVTQYHQYSDQFLAETESLLAFLEKEDIKGAQGGFRVISRTCSGCHQLYRE